MLSLFLLLVSTTVFGATPCLQSTNECVEQVQLKGGSHFSIYRSLSLEETNTSVRRIAVVVHGILRNADEYYHSLVTSAQAAGAVDSTLLISPHFKEEEDHPLEGELVFGDGWKSGNASTSPSSVGAYQVLEEILAQIYRSNHFPNLQSVVIIGHSAGGQYLSRFSILNTIDFQDKVRFHYIIANPSSYLYLDEHRAVFESLTEFEIPHTSCKEFNEYPYGLENPIESVKHIPPATVRMNARNRKLTVFLGGLDTGNDLLDMSCEAVLEGKNRIQRGQTYFNYLQKYYPSKLQSLVVVSDVEHDGDKMINSSQGQRLLFHE